MSKMVRKIDWNERLAGYIDEMHNSYHLHRKDVLQAMIPASALQPGRQIYDFGCGEGTFLARFLDAGARVAGSDIAPGMIDAARERLAQSLHRTNSSSSRLRVGGVEVLSDLPQATFDGMMALNVLAYLNPVEERTFYEQAHRALRKGGWLLVTHSNQLFDLFSLNKYTLAFMRDNLLFSSERAYAEEIAALLLKHDEPKGSKALPLPLRENPLNYRFKLDSYGFDEIRQEFVNRHEAPPPVLREQHYPDTLNLPPEERWKLLFTCSTFVSLSTRR